MISPRCPFPAGPGWLALLLMACLLALPAAAQERTAVIGARATLSDWSDPLEALGTLEAEESVTLSATVTETIAEVAFEGGERVEAGELLVRLDDAEERADLRVAEARRDERRDAVTRLARLQERNLAPRAQAEDSRAQLRQVEAEIDALRARLDDYRLRAPFDGVVGFRRVSVGTLATPGMELATLDKLDRMKLDFRVPEVALGGLAPGLPLTAESAAYPEARFSGSVAAVGTRVDPVSRSVPVRAVLPNPAGRLRPGMLMEVTLQRRPRQALVVPESALIPEGERHYVLVIHEDEDGRIERRRVRLGERRTGEAEVLEGLSPGELVVSHGVERTRDGARVRLLGIADETTSVRDLLEAGRGQGDA
ncbi:efflux RND transporter periplasmic adaptor subunit [Halomonas koreensis]|uniref:Efflux RND transporter periplasmic adaptor subunit n=1 Tax=Halomonas koreensis TaxID=245385 RepID=A0ABU1G6K3_9GAMM|nr:efflux RND transporter periplasmic adaptor subunit [Halomonas koreensis]MDR5868069.1 efflux RND transporter periplasmic adaptor subunit [Halomonas koreensis]